MTRIEIRLADWQSDSDAIRAVRRAVFIVEQNVPEDLDVDGSDVGCRHALAFDETGAPVGTARLGPEGRIGRMAVLQSHRRRGVGSRLLDRLINLARENGAAELHLHSQTHAIAFYQSFGFVPEGDEFLEAGIPHQRMVKIL